MKTKNNPPKINTNQRKILSILGIGLIIFIIFVSLGSYFYYRSATKEEANENWNINPNAIKYDDMDMHKKTENMPEIKPEQNTKKEDLPKINGTLPPNAVIVTPAK